VFFGGCGGDRTYASKALTAGKYLNVVRGCADDVGYSAESDGDDRAASTEEKSASGESKESTALVTTTGTSANTPAVSSVKLPKEEELDFDIDHGLQSLFASIERCHAFSSKSLLRILDSGHGLYGHLQSLRRFFLLGKTSL
jgi:hypothetical protein